MTLRLLLGRASWMVAALVCASCAGILGLDRGLPEDDGGLDGAGPPSGQTDATAGGDRAVDPIESGGPVPPDASADDGGAPLDSGPVPPPDDVAPADGPAALDAAPEDSTANDASRDATAPEDAAADGATPGDATPADVTAEDATEDAAPRDAAGDAAEDATADARDAEGPPADAAADRSTCATLECPAGGCCAPVSNGILTCNLDGTCAHACSQGYSDCGGHACSCGGGNVCLSNGSTGTCGACRKALGACQVGSDCCSGMCTLSLTCL